jgi:molybdenum cofactor guanylyltransferase
MANRNTAVVGVILAGGRGKRFGGIDKSFLVLAGRPLIVHVVGRIDGQVSRLVVNTNSTDVRYRELGAALCPDAPISKPATGPLVGLASVFAEIAAGGGASSYVLSVSVDTPFLPFDLTARLSDALRETGTRVAFAASGGRDHPTVALWDRGAGNDLRGLFDEQPEISLRRVMTRLGAVRVAYPDVPIDPFFNVNTVADLQEAERMIRRSATTPSFKNYS